MLGDDPPYLSVGTEVSAKYKGAFCEAKIRKVVRSVKCRVTYKQGLGTSTVTDDQIKGALRVGALVEAKHNDRKEFVEATITKIQDCSQYTVVFDDGDITTLRRTALCLKSGRHFAESETLDQLPLTHPEHFGNPVIGGRRGRRSRQAQDESSDEEDSPSQGSRDTATSGTGKEGMEREPEIGRVVCVELGDKKKKDNWFPGLVVAPTAQDTVRIRVRDDYLVRSFKDARYYTVPKKEATEFTKDLMNKVENNSLKTAVEKALLFIEKNELPPHWDRDLLFGNTVSSNVSESEADLESDSSDDEPREEKDHFVAQLYKFMDDRGTPINNCPMIGSEDIDLYRLFRAVYKLGGYNRVSNQNQWKSITRRLSFSMHNSPSTHNLVKQAYKKFLHSFEDFYRKLGCTMVNHPRGAARKPRPGRSLIRDKDRNTPIPPQQGNSSKCEKDEDEKKSVKEEDKEKKESKKEQAKEEESSKIKKKDDFEDNISGQDSDVIVDGEGESSSSEKSHKPNTQSSAALSVNNRPKLKSKEETLKKKTSDKKKSDQKKQDKKEEKTRDEETTKTRSKSKDDSAKSKNSEVRESRTPSRDPDKKTTTNKQRRLTDDEMKKRGRKRAKDSETEKYRNDEQSSNESAPCYKGPVELGDRLKVYYGPTHESKVTYEAKVIDIEKDGVEPMYLVHYTGWNTRYDEWIKPSRIAQNFTQTPGRVKRSKTAQRPQTPSSACLSSKTSKNGNASQNSSQSRRRAQSVAPTSNLSSGTSKDSKKDEKDKEKEGQPPRSTTPLSITSTSSRTKSPATPAANRQTRTTRNLDSSNVELRRRTRRTSAHTDISILSESEDTETYDSDITEPEQTKTRSRNTEDKKRREVKSRTEERVKPGDSDGEDDKDNSDEPRRGRRTKKATSKMQNIKSEPDSDEEQPKGRDFDLNQIRSELKGFDKAVKMELVRLEPVVDDATKLDNKENVSMMTPKVERTMDSPKSEPAAESKLAVDNTEDIYEFKEPEPFEFEVRNKRDNNGEKDKVKKRIFEEEPKSPKKKQRTVTSPIVKESKTDTEDSRKKVRKLYVKKNDEPSESPAPARPSQTMNLACEEAFDKLCESPAFTQAKPSGQLEETSKVVNSLDLLFSDLPGDDEGTRDGSEDRLIISETEVSEAEQENLFTYQQEIFPGNDSSDATTLQAEKQEASVDASKDDSVPSLTVKTSTSTESKSFFKSSKSSEARGLESKLLDITPVISSLTTPAPISARLPATSTIEEKLSAMAYRNKSKDSKKDEDMVESRKPTKEPLKKTDLIMQKIKEEPGVSNVDDSKENEKREDNAKAEEHRREVMRVAIKQKEEELQQLKLKKEAELKKFTECKIASDQKKAQDSRNDDWKTKSSEVARDQKEKDKRKKLITQEVEFSDSSDSEQRLVIDNDESQDVKINIELKLDDGKCQDVDKYAKVHSHKDQGKPETISEAKCDAGSTMKADEEGETMSSLLCEEEIPGSPAPPSDNANQENAESSCIKIISESSESSMALMEMPFASAPTSGQSTPVSNVATLSMSMPKSGEASSQPTCLSTQQMPAVPRSQPPSQQSTHREQPVIIQGQQRRESNEAAPVMDNTPPTTPDSSISNVSGSPREERTCGSSPISEDNLKHNRDSSEPDNDNRGAKGAGFVEEDALSSVEPGSADRPLKPPSKRPVEDSNSPKKRKRSRKHSDCGNSKKSGKQPTGKNTRQGAASDSDDTSEGSNLFAVNSSAVANAQAAQSSVNGSADEASSSSKPQRPMRYNFLTELDPSLDSNQRIAALQQRITEVRKAYNSVKVELTAIERRRKKLKRREREAAKAAKAEMQQACS